MRKINFWSIAALALAFAMGTSPGAAAHSGHIVDGVLVQLGGDSNPNLGPKKAIRLFYVRADDGHTVPVDLTGAAQPVGGIDSALGRRVRVTANPTVQADTLTPNDRFPATSLEVLGAAGDVAGDVFPISGNRKYVSLLCKWADDASEPSVIDSSTFFVNQLGSTYPGFNHFFQETSNGRANINGSFAMTSWVTMSRTRASYGSFSGDPGVYLHDIGQDCITAAEASVNFTGAAGINIMLNGKVDDCCAWGGGMDHLTIEGVPNSVVSMTWMPYSGPSDRFGWRQQSVLAHELSHSFQNPTAHSDDPQGNEYGNEWDVVSAPAGNFSPCGPAFDATYGCVGQHQIANHKISMDFVDNATRVFEHPNGGATATYLLERAAQAPNAGGTYQYLKVLSPTANKYYTVESRLRVGYDVNLPGDGVIIMEVITNRPPNPYPNPPSPVNGNPARLLTPSGSKAAGLGGIDSRWSPGDVYLNAADNVKITVVAFDAVTGTATIKVDPANAPGEYSFVATASSIGEGAPAALNVAVTRGAPFTAAGSVVWTTSDGTAVAGTDFGTLGNTAQKTGTLTWAAGTGGTKNITVGLPASNIPIINDAGVNDGDKDFTITLSTPVGGILGAQTSHTVTRIDTDSVISFAATTASVNEVGPNVDLTITRTGSTSVAQAVTFTTANGTAVAGSDFGTTTAQVTGTVTFGVGETTKTIALGPNAVAAPYIRIINDTTIEPLETFTVTLTSPTNGASLGTDVAATVTIVSEENGVSMAASTRSFTEGDGAQTFTVNRVGTVGAVHANYSFTNGTAVNGVHYDGTPGSLDWADGETGAKTIPVTIDDDGAPNASRTFTVTLSGVTGATLVAPMSTAATIADNDDTVQFSVATATVAENMPNLVLTVTRTGISAGQTAQVTWTALDGSAFAGTDFGVNGDPTSPTGTLNWAAGDAASKTVSIPIINNSTVQGARTFTVELSAPTGPNLSIGGNSDVAVTLNDDEKGVQFEFANYDVSEGPPSSAVLRVLRTGPSAAAISATWATVNGNAISGTDFGVLNTPAARTGTLSWLANDVAAKTITIPIINNAIGGQPDRLFQVNLTPGTGVVLGNPPSATVTIHDDDIPPNTAVQFAQPKYVVSENVGSAVLNVQRVDLGGGFSLASSVKFATTAGTALATTDYTTSTGTLNWAAFDTADKQISVPIVNNTIAEPPKGFKVVLSGANPGTAVGVPGTATVLILDDDEGFPAHGVMPPGFSTPGGVTRGWHVSNDPGAYEGAFALRSDEIDDGESAGLQMSGTFVAGSARFYVKVSTEPTFDTLQFFIDGVLQTTWSGVSNVAWQLSPTYPIGAGVHTLKWVYTKDASVSAGLDAVSLDGLVTPAFTP